MYAYVNIDMHIQGVNLKIRITMVDGVNIFDGAINSSSHKIHRGSGHKHPAPVVTFWRGRSSLFASNPANSAGTGDDELASVE